MKNVRIFFHKKGRMKFVSHLDMNRFMSRLIKKSGIPVWYTEGFNCHIYMNFALPLSLGYESFYEIMDIRLTDDNYSLDACLNALKNVCPEDIEFISITENGANMKEIGFAEYELTFDEFDSAFSNKLRNFLESDSIICQKTGKKGKVKEIDIIPKIRSYNINSNGVNLTLVAGSEDNLNPSLVMSAFFENCGIEPLFYSVKRVMIYNRDGQRFL